MKGGRRVGDGKDEVGEKSAREAGKVKGIREGGVEISERER